MSNPCVFCASKNLQLILSLGRQPLSNAYLKQAQLSQSEPHFPLDLYVCRDCMLCQIEVVATSEEIFSDYAYFSSYATSWLEHCKRYVEMITNRLSLGPDSFVMEVASNDGYLLQYFVESKVPCLGIEPAANVAEVAREKGIPTEVAFWGAESAERIAGEHGKADLILGNNVYAHVPPLNDLVEGFKRALKPKGTITLEFPHVMRMLEYNEFDTIYHEHFCYHSLFVSRKIFSAHGLEVFDVEELPTHGGSLRLYGRHLDDDSRPVSENVERVLEMERNAGVIGISAYEAFAGRVEKIRSDLLEFLRDARDAGKSVVGYGAPAKGNTLLNYCGVTPDDIAFTVDRNPHKQGLFLPGTHIPIRNPDDINASKPDYVLILPWNLKSEIMDQMAHIREWGGRFVVPIPHLEIIE